MLEDFGAGGVSEGEESEGGSDDRLPEASASRMSSSGDFGCSQACFCQKHCGSYPLFRAGQAGP